MRPMKDSKIKWIGQIPDSWCVERLKYHAYFNPATELPEFSDDDEVSFVPMDHLKSGFHNTSMVPYQMVKKGYVVFQDNDILMAKVTPCLENGNLAIAGGLNHGVGFGSTEINVIRCRSIDRRFLFYVLQCPSYIEEATYNMYGVAGLKRLDPGFIPNSFFPNPPQEEQIRIAEYLDNKCAEIDLLIAAKEKTNALLRERRQSIIYEAVTKGMNPNAPMKDSGVEWIGEIPANWTPIRLKYVINSIESGTSVNAEDHPCGKNEYGVLKTSCVLTGQFQSDQNKTVLTEEYSRLSCPVRKDSVIVSRMNTPNLVGACGYVENDHPNLFLPDRLWQVSFRLNCLSKYMWYFLSSEYTKAIYASICTGTSGSMQNISQEQLGDIIFFLPSINEQVSIVRTLDMTCEQMDSIIAENNICISQLKEYRKSLIYEAVTGKVEV
ncbi:MAG: restriction endonuclease subunit S [Oscillospiraceae bacterium]|nr:restriction endonuclease subunit S [Oscillospiraceae bacterium]